MLPRKKSAITKDVLEQAATWYVTLQYDDDELTLAAHRRWLSELPEHRQAWERVEKLQNKLANTPQIINSSTLLESRLSRRQAIKKLSLILTVGVVGAAGWQQKNQLNILTAKYRTATGERAQFTLADGTVMDLNTASGVDVDYTATERVIRLHCGEIHLVTAHDSLQRPLFVYTSQGSVRALGTRFTVRSDDQLSQVGVSEHAVELRLLDKNTSPVRLESGFQTQFTTQGLNPVQPLDKRANAWLTGLLVVSDWPLKRFINELSRYHRGVIRCDDNVAELAVSGAFHLRDTSAVLDNLTAAFPVQLHYFSRYWVRVSASPSVKRVKG